MQKQCLMANQDQYSTKLLPSPREGKRAKERAKEQVGRMLGTNLMLVGKQEDILTEEEMSTLLPRMENHGRNLGKGAIFLIYEFEQRTRQAFPFSWEALLLFSGRPQGAQPLEGRLEVVQHSCDWVLNSY